jgi:hypothetical protein
MEVMEEMVVMEGEVEMVRKELPSKMVEMVEMGE